jgi:membrane protein implicated in regulation of membrane protease activity
MCPRRRRWLVAALLTVTALAAGAAVGTAAPATPTDTTTGTPMGTSGNFPTETVAVAFAFGGILLASLGALALRRRDGPERLDQQGSDDRPD